MPSFRTHRALGVAVILLSAGALESRAGAQQAQGFALERFYPSAPGGGWFVMDGLDMDGGLGAAIGLTTGYAVAPLRVTDGLQHLTVVSDQAFTDFGLAVTYDRFRLYLNMDEPLVTKGRSGAVGDYWYAAPSLDLAGSPDTLSDTRIGLDARLLGGPKSSFRLGAGAQFIVPNGNRSDYDTDGTYRAMGRVLFAGDRGLWTYAGHLGVHVRPLDDSPMPGSPRGSELLFGLAGGARVSVRPGGAVAFIVGPELYGATAFRSFLGATGTAVEGLLTGRLEKTTDNGPQVRIKLGTGAGLDQHFGAPEWRLVFAIELSDHTSDRGPGK